MDDDLRYGHLATRDQMLEVAFDTTSLYKSTLNHVMNNFMSVVVGYAEIFSQDDESFKQFADNHIGNIGDNLTSMLDQIDSYVAIVSEMKQGNKVSDSYTEDSLFELVFNNHKETNIQPQKYFHGDNELAICEKSISVAENVAGDSEFNPLAMNYISELNTINEKVSCIEHIYRCRIVQQLSATTEDMKSAMKDAYADIPMDTELNIDSYVKFFEKMITMFENLPGREYIINKKRIEAKVIDIES